MKAFVTLILSLCLFVSCQSPDGEKLPQGMYRGTLEVQDAEILAFNFKVVSPDKIEIYNADEVITVDDIRYVKDSVYIRPPVFEGYLACVMDGNNLKGSYIKESLDRVVPFSAEYGSDIRYNIENDSRHDITGNWEAVFSQGVPDDEYPAKGIFNQQGNKIFGTFRTKIGDYRYLEGVLDGDQLKLSAFDGAHAFYFKAEITDSTMQGSFYSGNHFQEPFIAKRNDNFELPDADSLTFLKAGYDKFEFSFPDESGNLISLEDERFKDKVVVVQIMGTWCPNCLDESRYYSEFYKKNKDKNLEFVALAFEYAKTEAAAFKGIERLRSRLGIEYPVLLAQVGTSSKSKAQEKLPMLNHVLSYPTSLFIDKKGAVKKIHTGFNGPATGDKYEAFKSDFETFIAELLNE
ncbi:MAG: TlpA family protein disulfide reductase [Flavobacteriaceae bacterium]|nr:TlpA family protein disulfide reductase [Flavobacteriaceae bacterium]